MGSPVPPSAGQTSCLRIPSPSDKDLTSVNLKQQPPAFLKEYPKERRLVLCVKCSSETDKKKLCVVSPERNRTGVNSLAGDHYRASLSKTCRGCRAPLLPTMAIDQS